MLLRAIAIFLSLLLHGLTGLAMWPRLVSERLEVLDLGKGPDIILTPQGIVASEVTNLGDDVQTIETQDVVPIRQEHSAPAPPVKPTERLRDVIGETENTKTPEAVPVQEQRPKPERPPAAPEQLLAVIASQKSSIEQETGKALTPPPDQLHEPTVVEAKQPSPPSDIKEPTVVNANETPAPGPAKEPEVAKADVPAAPNQLEESTVSKADLPPPDQIKEPTIPCVDGTPLARTFLRVTKSWSVAPMCPACLLGANTDGLHAIRKISSRSKARARGALGSMGFADLGGRPLTA